MPPQPAVAGVVPAQESPVPLLMVEDVCNGAFEAVLTTVTMSAALGYHPVIPIVSFIDGAIARHWSRMRYRIVEKGADGFAANSVALATHMLIGAAKFGFFINPIAGYKIAAPLILRVSTANSLSKGSYRLVFDKAFGDGGERKRARGVCFSSVIHLGQGLLCSMAYRGSRLATLLQCGFAGVGILLLMAPSAKRYLDARKAFGDSLDEGTLLPVRLSRLAGTRIPELVRVG